MVYSNYVSASGSTTDTSISSNPSASGSIHITVCTNISDILDEQEWKKPPTPWKRSHAAYVPHCRVTPAFLRGRRLLAQQRPRDGLHAVN